jgi:hypothetical protein
MDKVQETIDCGVHKYQFRHPKFHGGEIHRHREEGGRIKPTLGKYAKKIS